MLICHCQVKLDLSNLLDQTIYRQNKCLTVNKYNATSYKIIDDGKFSESTETSGKWSTS